MVPRRLLFLLACAAALHAWAASRAILPASDGLKFIQAARQFQQLPWLDVVRGQDRHPLYPWLIARVEPATALLLGHGPTSFFRAAQIVSIVSTLLLLVALYHLASTLFDHRTGLLACLLWSLLPLPAQLARETLADGTALAATLWALLFAVQTIRHPRVSRALACGAVAGLGYWARPEVAIVPLSLLLALVLPAIPQAILAIRSRSIASVGWPRLGPAAAAPLTLCLLIGVYALAKGEISEKLAVRTALGLGAHQALASRSQPVLPTPLRGQNWDFSAKEESEPVSPAPRDVIGASLALIVAWGQSMAWLLLPALAWGVLTQQDRKDRGGGLIAVYCAGFAALMVRHIQGTGYLSERHVLSLSAAVMPWAACGLNDALKRIGRLRGHRRRTRYLRPALLTTLVIAIITLTQAEPAHLSRWGHREAGRWLARQAAPGEAVLDTRGWAAFVSNLPSYDYWHVGQALSDRHLRYLVVGQDELDASSTRAESLRRLLKWTATCVARFPGRPDGSGTAVRVYRLRQPLPKELVGS